MYGFQWWFVPYDKKEGWIFSGSGYGGQYLMVMPEYDIVVVFNGWNIFDFERPSIEYLSSRIIEAIDQNIRKLMEQINFIPLYKPNVGLSPSDYIDCRYASMGSEHLKFNIR